WGLVIGEAGMHRTPTVAYRAAGGTEESVQHDRSGILVDDQQEFTAALARLLRDPELRDRLGVGAEERSRVFSWEHSQRAFAGVLESALVGELVESRDQGTAWVLAGRRPGPDRAGPVSPGFRTGSRAWQRHRAIRKVRSSAS